MKRQFESLTSSFLLEQTSVLGYSSSVQFKNRYLFMPIALTYYDGSTTGYRPIKKKKKNKQDKAALYFVANQVIGTKT